MALLIKERVTTLGKLSWIMHFFFFKSFFFRNMGRKPFLLVNSPSKKTPSKMFYSSHRRCSFKKGVLKNFQKFTEKSTCAWVSFLTKLQPQAFDFIKKESLAHVFSSQFCEIFKYGFFTEHLWLHLIFGRILNTLLETIHAGN